MKKEQALQIIKQIVDQSIGAGLFKNTESVITASQALQVLISELKIGVEEQ